TKKSVEGESKSSYFVINKSEQKNAVSEEPSLDDYENIPIEGFGLAMLRGMGWKAGGSTSNSGSVFSTEPPLVRPRGLGLGADRITSSLIQKSVTKTGETLELAKGAYVTVTYGSLKGRYGQIEGFMGEDCGRVIIKLANESSTVSLNECAVTLVTKEEYLENTKVP
ncbi:hypothetical protein L9F63_028024, partial [Diploptera punctata]